MKAARTGRTGALWLVLTIALVVPLTAPAATNYYYVASGSGTPPFDTWAKATNDIQSAVDEAEGDLGPGTNCIVLVTNGTYTLTNQIEISEAITVESVNGRDYTFIDGGYPEYTNRCVYIDAAAAAILDGFTISNGHAYGAGPADYGGGVYAANGVVQNCTITENWSENGGQGAGVWLDGATLRDSMVSSNFFVSAGSTYGSGVFAGNGSVISNCVIVQNGDVNSYRGGGIQMDLTTVADCTVSSNTAKYGGGFYAGRGDIWDCEISYNYASPGGGPGGMYAKRTKVYNCLIVANESAGNNGGATLNKISTVFHNCTIVGNKSDGGAGGVSIGSGWVTNCIVYYNQADGVDNNIIGTNYFSYSCSPDLTYGVDNNTDASPEFTDPGSGYGLAHVRGDYTLRLVSPCIDTGSDAGAPDHDIAHDSRPEDGNHDSVTNYDIGCYEAPDAAAGALTCDFLADNEEGVAPLKAVFTAYISGDTNGAVYRWTFGDGTTNDWSAGTRVVTNTYAAGAYDVSLWVSNTAAEITNEMKTLYITVWPATNYVSLDGGHVTPFDTWGKAATNIQAAIDAAGDGYSMVLVSNGTYMLTNELLIDKSIVVASASGSEVTVIDGGYPTLSNRCVRMTPILGSTLDGFTVRNGYAPGAGAPDNIGGGVYVLMSGTVRNCMITSNTAPGGGGGVYLGPSSSLYDSTVSYNVGGTGGSPYGGGIHVDGESTKLAVVSNCVILCNTNKGYGGGIGGTWAMVLGCRIERNVNQGTGTAASGGGLHINNAVMIENCTIVSNYSAKAGGGVQLKAATSVLRDCLVAGNEAATLGGGVNIPQNTGARQRMENCTIVGNYAGTDGGGVYCVVTASSATNCIVYFNDSPAINDISGTVTNFSFSCSPDLVYDPAGTGNIIDDPQFVDQGSGYGMAGVLGDYHLFFGSPCVNSGTNLTWMTGDTDLAGDPRIQPVGGRVNMGAYELAVRPAGTVFLFR